MSKTLIEKLEAAKAQVAKLEAAINAEAILNNIEVGDRVTIKFGRAEKVRNIDGKVVGLNSTDNGLMVAVLSDDFTPYKVPARDVVANASAAARGGVDGAEVASDTPVASDALSDPLEAL